MTELQLEAPGVEETASAAPIRSATPDDTDRVIATVMLAFAADPFVRHWFPDPHQYLSHFPEGITAFGGSAIHHGTAHYADGFAGAALWLPPGVGPDEEALGALLRHTVAVEKQADLLAVLEQMGAGHPAEPHWYLPLIGVEPAYQRRGLGSALLKHALDRVDRENTPAYLEATSPENIPLYERHGFQLLGTIQAGASPPLFPMLRQPRT
jgi:ribosomal protein S18 acetylase RimI-like enzyme